MKAQAKDFAKAAARMTVDKDAAGNISLVTSPVAIRVLERVYTQMMRNGGRPVVAEISVSEARSFHCQKDAPSGFRFFMAAGLDLDRMPCMAIEGAVPTWHGPGEMPDEVRSQALAAAADYSRSRALARLENLTAVRGFG